MNFLSLHINVVLLLCLVFCTQVLTHVRFVCPRPHSPDTGLVQGPPCGLPADDGAPLDFTDVSPGPMTVRWEEIISHTGSPSRIALKSRSRSETCVLLDHIPHNSNQFSYSNKGPNCNIDDYPLGRCRRSSTYITVIIPDLECDDCYLQLISVDTSYLNDDDGPCFVDESSANCTVYYSCANIKIWPTPVGEGKYLNSCTEYPYNLDGPWPYSPISTFGVDTPVASAFFIPVSISFQFITLTYDVHPRNVNVTDIVVDSEGFYDVSTGLLAKPVRRVSEEPIYRGELDLPEQFLRDRLMRNSLGFGLRTEGDGLVIFRIVKQSTKFESGMYSGISLSYTSTGLLRASSFSGRVAVYTTPVEQSGPCALPTRGLNGILMLTESPGEVHGLIEMSHLEYNLYLTAILPKPNNASISAQQLYFTHTRHNIFTMTARLDVPVKLSQPRPNSYIYDGIADLMDFMILTRGEMPDTVKATLLSAVQGSTQGIMLTGTIQNGVSAVIRDEWNQITGMAVLSFGENTVLDTTLLVINFTGIPLPGGLYGPALPGRFGPRVFPPVHNITMNHLGNGTWTANAKIEANSAQYIRYLWSGWFYIDVRRNFNTGHRQISGQLSKVDRWACQNSSSVLCMVTELTVRGEPLTVSKTAGRTVPANAFVAFYPRESTLDFSIIIRNILAGGDLIHNVTVVGTENGNTVAIDATPPNIRPSTLESNSVEAEGTIALSANNRRLLEAGLLRMVLFTQLYPNGEIFGDIPSMDNTTKQSGSQRPPRPVNNVTMSTDEFIIECGTRADGPMSILFNGAGHILSAVYVENHFTTCSFTQVDMGFMLPNARRNNLADCGVTVTSGANWVTYEVVVVAQKEQYITRSSDPRFRLSCNYTGRDVEVIVATSSILVDEGSVIGSRQEVITGTVDQTYSMSVHSDTDLASRVSTADLGELLAFKVTMSGTDDDENSLQVRRCVARAAGSDDVVFLDNYCPVLRSVIRGGEGFVTNGTVAMLRSVEAFRPEGSRDGFVQLSCIIAPCSNRSACDGDNCHAVSARRKRAAGQESLVRIEVLFKVTDDTTDRKTVSTDANRNPHGETTNSEGTFSAKEHVLLIVFPVLSGLLFIALVVAVVACVLFKKRAQKNTGK